MRHYLGLAASPPGPYKLEVERNGNGLSLPVWCGRTTSSANRRRTGYGDTPAQGDFPCAHGGRQPAGTLPPKFHDRAWGGRMSEEVEAQQDDPTPVHEEEGALYESGVSSFPLIRESCTDG